MPKTDFEQRVIIILPKRRSTGGSSPRHKTHLLTILCAALAIVAFVHFIAVTHSAYPTSTPTTCQGWLRVADYAQVVHLQPKTQQIGAIQFVNQLVGGQPAALVQVDGTDTQQTLDVYIFGCVQQKQQFKMTTLYVQRGLIQGSVTVSSANTLITSALDTSQSAQNSALEQPLQQNIYREYQWQLDRFVQVSYPSLYPVTSRSEAEALQQQADSGQSLPWSDPLVTAEQMAKDILGWTGSNPQGAVLSSDDRTAKVQLLQQNPTTTVIVTLKRLVRQDKNGLWFVVGARAGAITLKQPQAGQPVTSPLTVTGAGALADGTITVTMFDHALSPLAFTNAVTPDAAASGNYTASLSYTSAASGQEGLLLVESLPPADSSETGQSILVKVILE